MKKIKFKFLGTGGNQLMAELDLPEGEVKYYALFTTCFTCSKNLRAVKYIAQSLNKHGIALLRFDFPGLGESEGDFSKTSYSTNLENIRLAYKYLENNYQAPKLLIGHSLGGAAALKLSMELKAVKAIATIAAANSPAHLAKVLWRNRDEAKEKGYSIKIIGGVKFKLTNEFFEDLYANGLTHDLSKVTKPTLTLYSPDDNTIEHKYSFKNFTDTSGQNSYISLNNMGHLMNNPKDANHVGNLIAIWSKAYCI